jgi:hypothetical protein
MNLKSMHLLGLVVLLIGFARDSNAASFDNVTPAKPSQEFTRFYAAIQRSLADTTYKANQVAPHLDELLNTIVTQRPDISLPTLLNTRFAQSIPLLHFPVSRANPPTVKLVLEGRADPDLIDLGTGYTASGLALAHMAREKNPSRLTGFARILIILQAMGSYHRTDPIPYFQGLTVIEQARIYEGQGAAECGKVRRFLEEHNFNASSRLLAQIKKYNIQDAEHFAELNDLHAQQNDLLNGHFRAYDEFPLKSQGPLYFLEKGIGAVVDAVCAPFE